MERVLVDENFAGRLNTGTRSKPPVTLSQRLQHLGGGLRQSLEPLRAPHELVYPVYQQLMLLEAHDIRVPLEDRLEQRRPRPREAEQKDMPAGAGWILGADWTRLPLLRWRALEVFGHRTHVLQCALLRTVALGVDGAQGVVAGRIGCKRFRHTVLRIEYVTQQAIGVRAVDRLQLLVGQQRPQSQLCLSRKTLAQVGRGETHHGIREVRHQGECLLGPGTGLGVSGAAARDMGETCERDGLARIKIQRPAIARLSVGDRTLREQCRAVTGVRER